MWFEKQIIVTAYFEKLRQSTVLGGYSMLSGKT